MDIMNIFKPTLLLFVLLSSELCGQSQDLELAVQIYQERMNLTLNEISEDAHSRLEVKPSQSPPVRPVAISKPDSLAGRFLSDHFAHHDKGFERTREQRSQVQNALAISENRHQDFVANAKSNAQARDAVALKILMAIVAGPSAALIPNGKATEADSSDATVDSPVALTDEPTAIDFAATGNDRGKEVLHTPLKRDVTNRSGLSPFASQSLEADSLIATKDICSVEVHANIIRKGFDFCMPFGVRRNGVLGTLTNKDSCLHHTLVVTRTAEPRSRFPLECSEFLHAIGTATYFRGGPDGIGRINVVSGAFLPGSIDFDRSPTSISEVAKLYDPGCAETNRLLSSHSRAINRSQLQYITPFSNSNTVTSHLVTEALGLEMPRIPAWSPGISGKLRIRQQ
jgi:hypothetical protein